MYYPGTPLNYTSAQQHTPRDLESVKSYVLVDFTVVVADAFGTCPSDSKRPINCDNRPTLNFPGHLACMTDVVSRVLELPNFLMKL